MSSTKTLLIIMATLTYDPTPADQPEFTPDEQESIAIGEQLEQAQEQLLAGKYRNAEELERAYVELQGKLGQPEEEGEEEEGEYEEGEEVEGEEEEGEYEDDDDEDDYEMTDEDIDQLMAVAGGEEQYNEMVVWAKDNLSQQEIDMFDHVIDMEDPYAMFFAIRALSTSYTNAMNSDGELLTGNTPFDPTDSFRSQAEVIEAMNNPRYDRDPAYRQDVFDKLDRSNINF